MACRCDCSKVCNNKVSFASFTKTVLLLPARLYSYLTAIFSFCVILFYTFSHSLNHVHALAEKTPNGKIISVKETRLTHLGIHLLCFISIFALHVLKVIPMPVLYVSFLLERIVGNCTRRSWIHSNQHCLIYFLFSHIHIIQGVFLFMGLVSLGTNQFWGRIQMFFMQSTKYPIEPYTQFMKPKRMHIFTMIQVFLFFLLYFIKSFKPIAILFPIIIALCIPVR